MLNSAQLVYRMHISVPFLSSFSTLSFFLIWLRRCQVVKNWQAQFYIVKYVAAAYGTEIKYVTTEC